MRNTFLRKNDSMKRFYKNLLIEKAEKISTEHIQLLETHPLPILKENEPLLCEMYH